MKINNIYRELAEFQQRPVEKILEEYDKWLSGEFALQQKDIAESKDESQLIDFYGNCLPYLCSLALYEDSKTKELKFKIIKKFCEKKKIKKVLDYGGGIGDLCIYLRKNLIECDYLDIKGCISDFSKWRFRKNNLNVNFYTIHDDVILEKCREMYDLVISLDVLEHVFDIQATLKKINNFLKKDAFFILSVTFAGGGIHLPKNAIYLDISKFNSLMCKNNFIFMGQLKRDRFTGIIYKLGMGNFVLSARLRKREKHGGNLLLYRKI